MKLLVVDDEENTRKSLSTFLRFKKYDVETAEGGEKALELLKGNGYHVVLTDLKMPGMDGLELTERIKKAYPDVHIIVMTAYGTIKTAVDAMKKGAFDYLTKPLNQDELLISLARIKERLDLTREVKRLRIGKVHFGILVGVSPEMQRIYDAIEKAGETDSTVFITGETGTGKELVARAIHMQSKRRKDSLVEVNCAALPESLAESELFGHVKGAFTGAIRDRMGKFENADGGTILLDEVTTMTPYLQAKLLRVLQERKIEPVGSNKPVGIDVRVIAISNESPEKAVKEGRFREDLYYRLNVISMQIPPLRDRKGDIPFLVEHFIQKYSKGKALDINSRVMDIFMKHSWPGNVRELVNAVESMIATCDGRYLTEEHLPSHLRSLELLPWEGSDEELKWGERMESFEKYLIARKLHETKGRVERAAQILGLPIRSMRRKMAKYGLKKEMFKG